MRRVGAYLLLASIAAACIRNADEEVDRHVREFMGAAARSDTSALMRLTSDARVLTMIETIRRQDPALLQRLATDLEYDGGDVARDSARYFYEIEGYPRRIAVGLVRGDASAWRVYHVGFPER